MEGIPARGRMIMLRLAEPSDAEFILSLRNDSQKGRYLSPTPTDVEAQRRWLVDYKERERLGSEYYFIMETISGSKPCGVARIYDIDGGVFTWGSWITAHDAPRKTAFESVCLVYRFAFEQLGLSLGNMDVKLENLRVLAFNDRFGSVRTRVENGMQYFTYSREKWLSDRPKYAKFLTS